MPIVVRDPPSPGWAITERRFGFIPLAHTWRVGDLIVEPVPHHDEVVARIREIGHDRPGHAPPFPIFSKIDFAQGTPSRFSDDLFRLPPTHLVRKADGGSLGMSDEFSYGEGAVLIESLGFLNECRCQFDDWLFEGDVPLKARELFRADEVALAATEILRAYRSNLGVLKKRLPRLLFMKNRFECYAWVWEQFLVEYTVFDALWKIGELLGTAKRVRKANGKLQEVKHRDRFKHLGQSGLIHWEGKEIDLAAEFVVARNDLVHEALFDKASVDSLLPRHLARLTSRLLFSVLGISCSFARGEWYGFSADVFGFGN